MADYKEVKKFLKDNNITDEEMDMMWKFMYNKNSKVKQLTDCGKDWSDLNPFARKDLIKRYKDYIVENS